MKIKDKLKDVTTLYKPETDADDELDSFVWGDDQDDDDETFEEAFSELEDGDLEYEEEEVPVYVSGEDSEGLEDGEDGENHEDGDAYEDGEAHEDEAGHHGGDYDDDIYDADDDYDGTYVDPDEILEAKANRFFKRLRIAVVSVVVIIALASLGYVIYSNNVQKEKSEKIRALTKEKNQYTEELEALIDEHSTKINEESCVVLAFTDLYNGVVDDVIKYMDEKGYKGLIVFKNGRCPGDSNSISLENYKKLMSRGWQAAIGSDDDLYINSNTLNVKKWCSYIDYMQETFEKKGLDFPEIYCFRENEDYTKIEDEMAEYGFETWITIEEGFDKGFYSAIAKTNRELIGFEANVDNYSQVVKGITDKINKGKSTVLLFNKINFSVPESGSGSISFNSFKYILEGLDKSDKKYNIVTVDEYFKYLDDLANNNTDKFATFYDKRNELIEKIDEVNKKINEIKK